MCATEINGSNHLFFLQKTMPLDAPLRKLFNLRALHIHYITLNEQETQGCF